MRDLEGRTTVPPGIAMLPAIAAGDEYTQHAGTLADGIVNDWARSRAPNDDQAELL